jgi:asparagine synthase (glutamine-hydrolysing)
MCGLTGFFGRIAGGGDPARVLGPMTDALAHRGPDADGTWVDAQAGVALGHRRLSILDLTACGAQPMLSRDGRHVLAYNGEIYNFRAMHRELEAAGVAFRGHSDTEVLLAGVQRWGVNAALARCAGMFAFALWDGEERTLHLARDRFGEKPLYYGWVGGTLVFGSELKALRRFPGWQGRVDRGALALYLRHGYVPGPHAIFEGVRKVEPGTVLSFRRTPEGVAEVAGEVRYWSALDAARRGLADPLPADPETVLGELETTMRRVVGEQMVADVPLGAFLSGGVDSSTIVALMQAAGSRRVRTFTIGFHEEAFDEAGDAREVAAHLGTEHTELYVTGADALGVIDELPRVYDEPFADSSQIPTILVARMARAHVTVALSGDGADELFAGYNRYTWGRRIWDVLRRVPQPMRALGARALLAVPPAGWDRAAALGGNLTRRAGGQPGDKIHKLAGILAVDGPDALYRELVTTWPDPDRALRVPRVSDASLAGSEGTLRTHGMVARMQYLDTVSYLPDDILVKVDRAAMSASLETRAPFVDHRVAELAWRIPQALKMRDGVGKWIVRQLLYRYVPPALVDRPKKGFGVPLAAWLRGPLRPWAEDLLTPDRLARDGFFVPAVVRQRWAEHLSGRRNWQYALWNVLMFQAWHDAQ